MTLMDRTSSVLKERGHMADKNQKIYDKFDPDVSWMIIHAKAASINAEVDCLYPESFVIGILNIGENSVTSLLLQSGVDLEKCLKTFKLKLAEKKNKKSPEDTANYENLKKAKIIDEVIRAADKNSIDWGQDFVSLQHIFLAILQLCPDIRKLFENEGMNFKEFIDKIKKHKQKKSQKNKVATNSTSPSSSKGSILDTFCVNMTEQASQNKYDPIIAREAEIEEAITILCRRNKSNPILIGEPGVGKTAIVEGICQRIVSNTVPKKLRGSRIYAVDVAGMVAGTKYRGEFEKRLQDLLKELKDDEGAILFIDEIHSIVGAGSASGSLDAANMMKPALARYLKCIGATTNAEYKKYFSGDGALERRFEKLEIDEPSKENVHKILSAIKPRLEEYHKCLITDNAIDMAIRLTDRYTPEKHFPDKAISCLDTACAKYAWIDNDQPTISPNDIAMVISKQTKIPMEVILWDNFERIKNTENSLISRVIGQDHAVKTICRTLKNAYSGVRNPDKPIGIFVFGGPSGTGKTYLAKELAKILFSSETSFVRMDMSEYSEPHSVSKITGSPPGYVGFNEVNIVADKIRRKPYCVLLLDEMEKSHPDVMKLFLQVMSDGAFSDSVGNKVNCKNLILIMTGNFGMNTKSGTSIGFTDNVSKSDIQIEQTRLIQYCKDRFGAEFVNRIDDFVPFVSLTEKDLIQIAKLRMEDFITRIHKENCKIVFGDGVAENIVEMSKDEHGMNANVINRIIEKNLETVLADAFLSLDNDSSYTINVDIKDGEFTVKSKKINRKQPNEQTA